MTTAALVPVQPAFTDAERFALAGFLAGYRGLTREAYALDLRQFTAWCRAHSVALFAVRRADIESFARDLEARGRARSTVTRRLCTIAGFYKYAVLEELLQHSPAAHVRRPRLDYESHAIALDRNELGALLVAAGLGAPGDHALISLLALNGLRVSEATGADASVIQPGVYEKDREEIRANIAAAFAGPLNGSRVAARPVNVRFVTGDTAIVVSEDGIIFPGQDAVASERLVRATWVLVRRDGGWRIASYHNSPAS